MRIIALLLFLLAALAGFFSASHLLDRVAFFKNLASVSIFKPFFTYYRLGLDLQGGTHLVYRADFSNFQGVSKSEAMDGLRDVIERRVNLFGVAEPVVQVENAGGEYRLIVELAGVRDIGQAIQLIGQTPFLEFKQERSADETKAILDAQKKSQRLNEDPYFVQTELTGRYLSRAELQFDPTTNAPLIGVTFNSDGAALFEKITGANVGKPLGIYLDGALLSLPNVREKISGGKAQITGQFTLEQARQLVARLNSGALPVPISLIGQESIGASLGEDTLAHSLKAALYGFLVIALFMVFWYRLPGFIAVIALSMYVAFLLALFKMIPVTLTAAGIAGFILSIGMAVDANILIFERMKEELRRGRALPDAVTEGFMRAWTSIRDSNVSTLITAAVLFWFGTSVVKGFALTLGLGVIVSMFSAISVSRTFLLAVLTPAAERRKWLFGSQPYE